MISKLASAAWPCCEAQLMYRKRRWKLFFWKIAVPPDAQQRVIFSIA